MPQYTNNIPITFVGGAPLVACANGARAISNPINNSVTQYDVVDIEVKLKLGASGVVAGGSITLAFLGSDDGGVTYDTFIQPGNTLETITKFISNAQSMTIRVQITNVPQYLKFVVLNNTGAAFDSTGANFACFYAGVTDQGQLALATSQTTVTTVATLLAASSQQRQNLAVSNMDSQTVFLGTNVVTTGQGFPLVAGATIEFDNFSSNALYGIVTATTANVAVLQY